LIGATFVFFAQFAAYTFVSPYLEQLVHLEPATITLALLVFGVAGVIGNFLAGFALSRSITATVVGAMAIAAVSIILLPVVAGTAPGAFLLLALWGVIWGGLPLAMQTWVIDAAPEVAEGGLALFVTTIQISIAAGSTVGAIAVSSAGISFDFWLAGAIAAVGAVTVFGLWMLGGRRAGQVPLAE
jgi:predicted MFS family arabinose efflux permease